jgi:cytochrome c biogenesis protein CcmG, thiol:disulfide interchange protein DsbE
MTIGILPNRYLLAATLVFAAACERPDADAIRPLRAGDAAPAFSAPTLAGDTVALVDLRGDAVLLNIWATWCIPCREEMPLLEALHRERGAQGLHVIGVSIDASGMNRDIREFLDAHGITFTVLHDPAERVTRAFRSRAVPETFLIGRDGIILRRWIGQFDPLAEDALRDIDLALGAS